ncbi:MmgE/PrpD family protein [Tianweitania sp. BSSL-BM11]|uniref:MmgE/PrpD family protein n=1 Tax=Tianweitania aestuarii TaxID=2814886 RepID=A0ABS5RXQ1_9HYPH|nr:MmgE/PrpD family protein [Tianweitania aestuarii]MBS9721804.1 MmgE/PrpD family protein [Tianweitania aestuarii]
MTLSADVIARLRSVERLPDGVQATAVRHFTDAIGVAHGAAGSQAGAHWRKYAKAQTAQGTSSVIGLSHGLPAATAALVNGGLIHSLEYDDTHTGSIVHGSAVLAATALAAGEAAGATGAAVMRSYALWYEVFIRFGLAAAGGFQNRGFQLTSVGGALCAAGIAADLKGLDADASQAAIGIALSQASGVFEFLTNGATVKSMHPGWAAHAGLIAADLAEAGMTGPFTALEGKFGLFRVFAGDDAAPQRFADMLPDMGEVWHLDKAAYKFHPCCHYLHPFIEAARLMQAQGVRADQIARFDCGVPKGAAGIIAEPWASKVAAAGHQARWSLPVTVAMQMVDGRVDLASFEEPLSPGVLELAELSDWHVLTDSAFPALFDAYLRLTLKDGRVVEKRIDDVYGNGSRPPAQADLDGKFAGNMERFAPGVDAAPLLAALTGLPKANDLGEVTRTLRSVVSLEE